MALVEFRDGSREVPDHLADLMSGLQTYKLTFDQARKEADERLTRELLEKTQRQLIEGHFRRPY